MENSFSISDALKKGWALFVERWTFLVVLQVLTFVAISLANYLAEGASGVQAVISWVLSFSLQLIVGMGTLSVMLHIVDGEEQTYSSLFEPINHFWVYAGAVLLTTLGTILGLLLLLVPGVIFAVGVCFAQYLIIDKNLSVTESLKTSWEKTRGSKKQLALFLLSLIGVNVLGVAALGIGILVSVPVSGLAYAHVYRHFFPKQLA